METSWYGLFDLSPDETVEIRAGDLQEFLRQQAMGVTNPGLEVEVKDAQTQPATGRDAAAVWDRLTGYIETIYSYRHSDDLVYSDELGEVFANELMEVVEREAKEHGLEDKVKGLLARCDSELDDVHPYDVADTIGVWAGEDEKAVESGIHEEPRGNPEPRPLSEEAEREAEEATPEITKDMVRKGIELGIIRFEANPDSTDSWKTVCAIGNGYFYFVDTEGIAPEEYVRMNRNNLDMVVDDVYDALNGDVLRDYADDYGRYLSTLRGGIYVRDWYMQEYPSDMLGVEIDPDLTFPDALDAVARGGGFYDALGVGDSIVRERVFDELAERFDIDRDDIYKSWLQGDRLVRAEHEGFITSGELEDGLDQLAESMRTASSALDGGGRDDRKTAIER